MPLRSVDSMLSRWIIHAKGNCTIILEVNDLGNQSNSNWMKIICAECKVIKGNNKSSFWDLRHKEWSKREMDLIVKQNYHQPPTPMKEIQIKHLWGKIFPVKKEQYWLLQAQVHMNIIWNGAYNPDHSSDERNWEPLFQKAIESTSKIMWRDVSLL